MSGALAGYKKRGIVYVTGSLSCPYASQSYPLGVALARAGYSLMTGGGPGVAKEAARGFTSVPKEERKGRSIAVTWGPAGGYRVPGYPNEYCEVSVGLNLPRDKVGDHAVTSRNHANEADVCVAFPGDSMTRRDIELCVGYEHPVVVHPSWSDCCPSLWDFRDVEDCMAVVHGVMRDRGRRPNVHKLKVANVLRGRTAEDLRAEESKRTLEKGEENEFFYKELEKLEQRRLLDQPQGR
mmetsp:Transcript_25728/g.51372  ORF Transcript_25728/g.51372 Transcript_25728/m.51372 type:complete len:238 (+) Transcript_25728:30-743(+)